MRCPFCSHEDTQVKDSRPVEEDSAIRRRRSCHACGGRFTTFERIQLRDMSVIKSDGTRESFDREKIAQSMETALRKRPVEHDLIEKAVSGIVRQLESMGESELDSKLIGNTVLEALHTIDKVAYVRFASVYKEFSKAEDFEAFIQSLSQEH